MYRVDEHDGVVASLEGLDEAARVLIRADANDGHAGALVPVDRRRPEGNGYVVVGHLRAVNGYGGLRHLGAVDLKSLPVALAPRDGLQPYGLELPRDEVGGPFDGRTERAPPLHLVRGQRLDDPLDLGSGDLGLGPTGTGGRGEHNGEEKTRHDQTRSTGSECSKELNRSRMLPAFLSERSRLPRKQEDRRRGRRRSPPMAAAGLEPATPSM